MRNEKKQQLPKGKCLTLWLIGIIIIIVGIVYITVTDYLIIGLILIAVGAFISLIANYYGTKPNII